ncbi:Protein AHC1 [Spathaspora sp. JA1]|nr:Protein AHC1 [Spathaspora sp. JA1]
MEAESDISPNQTPTPIANDNIQPQLNEDVGMASELSQQDIIIKRLREIPHEQLKEIITNQIDLEIRLKHKELNLNDHEISKIESQMLILRKFFDIPNQVQINQEPNNFTMRYFELLNKSLNATYDNLKKCPDVIPTHEYIDDSVQTDAMFNSYPQGGHAYRTRSTTSSLRPSTYSVTPTVAPAAVPGAATTPAVATPVYSRSLGCLYRRTDGIIVRLTCPDCQRSNFSSAQGFLNHSRIAHSKEYTSQDAAALKCGEILSEIKQDQEGEASLNKLNERGVDPNRNLNINEIYFHGLSNSLNSVHQSKVKSTPSPPLTNASTTSLGSDSELFKKLIKEGNLKREEYEEIIRDTKQPLNNPHLFDDEFEIESCGSESSISAQPSTTSLIGLNKRRQSRGGIKIVQEPDPEVKFEETTTELEDSDIKRRKR